MGMWTWVMILLMVISSKWWCGCCLGCWDEERIALLNLKSSLHFPTVSTSDCCQWEVVECDPISGRVTKLSFNNTRLFTFGLGREHWLFNASLFLPFQQLTTLLLQGTRLVGSVENEGFDRLSGLSKLEVLDLSDNFFINNNNSNLIFSSLSRLSSLKSLSLRNIQQFYVPTMNINLDGFDRLSRLSKLEVLDLSDNFFNNNSNIIISSLGRLSSLKSLSLRNIQQYSGSTMNNIDGFDRLSRLSKLEVLDLSDNYFNNNSNIIISSLGRLSSLKSLFLRNIQQYLYYGSTMNFNIDGFAGLSRLSKLEVLDLSLNNFNNSILSSLSRLSSLKSLYLNGFDYPAVESTLFAGSERLTSLSNLEILHLSSSGINNSILSVLKTDDFVSLKELNLSDNRIKSFESIRALSNLEILDLSYNNLNDSVLSSLFATNESQGSIHSRKIDDFVSLKELYLFGNRIKSFEPVRALSNLEILDLGYNNFNDIVQSSLFATNESQGSNHRISIKSLSKLKVLKMDGIRKINIRKLLQSLGSLPSLKTLHLEDSTFEGAIFTTQDLRNVGNLEELFLNGSSSLNNSFLENIGALTSLKTLSLSECGFSGSLPVQGWCELKNLQELDLGMNEFEGTLPPCFRNFTSLRKIILSYNRFSGNIAMSPLAGLTSLEYLSFSSNSFQVPISLKSFANHSNLKVFLGENNIAIIEPVSDAWVPTFQLEALVLPHCPANQLSLAPLNFLYYQHDLRSVVLSQINLGGTFPTWLLMNNTRLVSLSLQGNSFTGPFRLPSRPNPYIEFMDISGNNLQGQLPENISSTFPSLRTLNLSRNLLNGDLISRFNDMKFLTVLDLSNNFLSGMVPDDLATGCPSLSILKLSNNSLYGQISPTIFNLPWLFALHLNQNNFVGDIPGLGTSFTIWLFSIDFSDNHFTGKLPRWIGNMTSLRELLMAKNHFQGHIPVEYCKLDELQLFDLSENNLSGSIPSCFNPPRIRSVHLIQNRLKGPLPDALLNSSSLVRLDLSQNEISGKIPNSIGSLSSLTVLVLKGNNLEGEIPIQLCHLSKLSILDLSQNRVSGLVPTCLSNIPFKATGEVYHEDFQSPPSIYADNLNHDQHVHVQEEHVEFTTKNRSDSYKGNILNFMSGIDLSCNILTGEIPPQLGDLKNIHALNLSHNNLRGSIPTTFSNLQQIESLDLSYNNLTGKIPSQLIELKALEVFSVAHNNLSGTTPDRKAQFATFEEPSYVGNPLLCGPPLPKSCNEAGSELPLPLPNSSDNDVEDHGFIDMESFYITFSSAYVIVVLGIAAILYINPHWRRVWFYLIEMWITSSYYFVVDNFPKLPNLRNM